jgi:hypothetical protein
MLRNKVPPYSILSFAGMNLGTDNAEETMMKQVPDMMVKMRLYLETKEGFEVCIRIR